MAWQDTVKQQSELILTTCTDEGKPHAILVISKGLVEGKITFGLCGKWKTYNNLKRQGWACIVAKKEGEYYRIEGGVEFHETGDYFDEMIGKCTPPMPIVAVLVDVKSVFDLDKSEKVI